MVEFTSEAKAFFARIRKFFIPREIKSKSGVIHFRRFRILTLPWFSIYIHQFFLPDSDKHMHDHPWNFFNMILKGGYIERFIDDNRVITSWKGVGNFGFKSHKYTHKVEKVKPHTYTLFITGKRITDDWGYQTELGWMQHAEYRKAKREGRFEKYTK